VADDPELAEFATIIVNAQKRLTSMVDEMRDFVAGHGETLEREPADVAAIVEEALTIIGYDRDVRDREVVRKVKTHPLARLHRQKFCQVVINLVSNAVLATEPGDVIEVHVDSDPDAGVAIVTVLDQGEGMAADVLERLGEPFFTTRGERGSGLGVGICMSIVEEHGGELTFKSKQGAGTSARVTVPLLEAGM
jgi:signal transduction histidine kinase